STQINTYVAAKLEQPQSTHRYYEELLESNRPRMFNKGDKLEEYYISALALKRIERAFKKNALDGRYKAFKYHLIYVTYQFYATKRRLTSDYGYEDVITELSDQSNFEKVLMAGMNGIVKCFKKSGQIKYDAARSKAFTDSLKQELKRQLSTKPSNGRAKGARR
ncbi:hypothetical protein, partial [Candidatus Thiosymbion oneisti]